MPGHHSDPGWYPDFGEKRPNLFVPFRFLRSTSSCERKSLLIGFYERFRRREAFDNHSRVNPRPLAGLREIYDCYCEEYIGTVNKARKMDGALTFKRGENMNHGLMGWEAFADFLYVYDEDQLARQVTPPRSHAPLKDEIHLWNKYDGFGPIKDLFKSSNPVRHFDHSSHANDGWRRDIKDHVESEDPVIRLDHSSRANDSKWRDIKQFLEISNPRSPAASKDLSLWNEHDHSSRAKR